MKRIGDLVIACTLIALILPLMTIVVMAIRLDSPGPVFSRHNRRGLGGRQISALKFRTTVHNPRRTRRRGAQVTRVGWLLRYTHIDDLPQLVNVVRGEMSLVGISRERPDFLR